MTGAAIQVTRQDPRLLGSASIAVISASRLAVACRSSRRVVTMNRLAGLSIAGDSGDLGGFVGAMTLFSSALWTITEAGNLLKLTTADTPALSSTTNIHAATSAWITSYSNALIVPGRIGGILTLNSSAATLATLDGVLSRVAFAVCSSSGYLYAFDGRGMGAVVTINGTTWAMTPVGTFTAANCEGVLNGFISGTTLYVAVGARNAIVTFDISTAAAPSQTARTAYDSTYRVTGVLDDTSATALTDEPLDALAMTEWHRASCGHYINSTEKSVGQGRTGRLMAYCLDYATYTIPTLLTNGLIYSSFVSGDTLYIGGLFTTVTGTNGTFTRNNAACVNLLDGTVNTYNPNVNQVVRGHALLSGIIYLVGDFTTVGGVTRNYAGAVDATTGALQAWNPNLGSVCHEIEIDSGTIYIVGSFTTVGGVTRNRAAALNAAGSLQTWNPNLNSDVFAIAVDSTRIYLGGPFTTLGGVAHGQIAGVNKTTGAYDSTFTTVAITGGAADVRVLVIYNGIMYFGGDFTSANANGRNYMGAVTTSGVLQTWNPNANGACNDMCIGNGVVYACGAFTTIGGAAQAYGVAIQTDGTVKTWPSTAYTSSLFGIDYNDRYRLLAAGSTGGQFLRYEAT